MGRPSLKTPAQKAMASLGQWQAVLRAIAENDMASLTLALEADKRAKAKSNAR